MPMAILIPILSGCTSWFAPQLAGIAAAPRRDPLLDVHTKLFVTCFCDPEAAPAIANSEITFLKPNLEMIHNMINGEKAPSGGGGLGVASSGPEGLVDETRNAVAAIGPRRVAELGTWVALHTEVYCL